MDVSSFASKLVSGEQSSIDDMDQLDSDNNLCEAAVVRGELVEDLVENLSKSLSVHEACPSPELSVLDGVTDAEAGSILGEINVDQLVSLEKRFSKSATFPLSGDLPCSDVFKVENIVELGGELQAHSDQSSDRITRSVSLPSPLKLVSAMKGSREKQGTSPKKLTVRWAPDVYDPTPSIVSHTVKGKKKQTKYEKKTGKGKQKGSKASRGNNGKDKKRKIVGNSKRSYKLLDGHEKLVGFDDSSEDFEVGSPDYCGSSFLRNSLTNVHISVTEAL